MNKEVALRTIAKSVKNKHPWSVSQDKYLNLFKEFPKEYLAERLHYDNLLEKAKHFKLLHLIVSEVKVEINLTLDELIVWELSLDRWAEAVRMHDIVPGDIKKLLKEMG